MLAWTSRRCAVSELNRAVALKNRISGYKYRQDARLFSTMSRNSNVSSFRGPPNVRDKGSSQRPRTAAKYGVAFGAGLAIGSLSVATLAAIFFESHPLWQLLNRVENQVYSWGHYVDEASYQKESAKEKLRQKVAELRLKKIGFVEVNQDAQVSMILPVTEVLVRERSQYQLVEILKSPTFGNILAIDGQVQITERDEANYHEMICHVPLNIIKNAKRVLIVGGGDGGALYEALRHNNVEEVVLVDIDECVVRNCKHYFSKFSRGWNDPRARVVINDASQWVKSAEDNYFDVIIIDSTDFNCATPLFGDEFFTDVKRVLKRGGCAVVNVESPSWSLPTVVEVTCQLRQIFRHVKLFQVFQPCFTSGHYCFAFISDDVDAASTEVDWKLWNKKAIRTDYYTPEIHKASFQLPNLIQRAVE